MPQVSTSRTLTPQHIFTTVDHRSGKEYRTWREMFTKRPATLTYNDQGLEVNR